MVDYVKPYQAPQWRRADSSDTHQYLQRHDPDHHRKKDDNQEGGFKDPYEDLTDVSLQGLFSFLEGLVQNNTQTTQNQTDLAEGYSQQTRAPMDSKHANAMNAYHARQNDSVPALSTSSSLASSQQNSTALDKAAAQLDQNRLKALLRRLQQLSARGIKTISLEREDDFLASIEKAVELIE